MRKSRFLAPASAGALLLAILSLTVFTKSLASGPTDPVLGSSITRLENFSRDPVTQGWTAS